MAVPDLRIVDEVHWEATADEVERRRRDPSTASPTGRPRQKHLLSGLIKCSCCGSSYVISGKDYYRCIGKKERGTCLNSLSVRKGPFETATLAVLHHGLLTEEHTEIFAAEFAREMARLSATSVDKHRLDLDRLAVVQSEIETLATNMLRAVASPTLLTLLADREAEKTHLERRLSSKQAEVRVQRNTELSHSAVISLFKTKVADLRDALNDDNVPVEAAKTLATLIESVTIDPDAESAASKRRSSRRWPTSSPMRQTKTPSSRTA
ncbi:zinc ribbon domain-containing protein [Sphingomonas prati]|uniref:Recombinase zinc beta ribbon domain-containing protein n=1 Tax=Sphingomonas prati TaxID=1843237 RepID=A0A7W9BVD6_9SPHN|nr:zinc ribbon domain-containing protein [Sphingomonas prati]MBB5730829.1 hypothetical protein [Sphingomonas prati]